MSDRHFNYAVFYNQGRFCCRVINDNETRWDRALDIQAFKTHNEALTAIDMLQMGRNLAHAKNEDEVQDIIGMR